MGKKKKIEILDNNDIIENLENEDNIEVKDDSFEATENIEELTNNDFEEENIEELNNKDSNDTVSEEKFNFEEPEKNIEFELKKEEVVEKEPQKIYKNNDNNITCDNTKTIRIIIFGMCLIILMIGAIMYFNRGENESTSKRYKISSYDNNKQFKTVKQLSINDSIILRDEVENKDITYNFKIKNGKVVITNDYGFYEIDSIDNADKLVVNTMGNLLEDTGVFITTEDGDLYSISLYDDKSKLITDCEAFKDRIDKYDLSFKVKNIESGFYSNKDGSGIEGIILITDTDKYKHVLTTKKNNK